MGHRLQGKVGIVTGGGGGIGRSVAMGLAAEGASVVVSDLNRAAADKVVAEIKKLDGKAVASYDNVTEMSAGQNMANTAVSNFGRIDVLVNCAGNQHKTPTIDMTQEQWDSTMAVHVRGHFSCSQAVARVMIPQKTGSIVNIASRAAFTTNVPRGAAYGTAKAAVMGFTAALAAELEQYGIRVNAILPNATTNLFPGAAPRAGGHMPTTEILDPDYVAPMIVYLATDEAKSITGQFIYAASGDIAIYEFPLTPRIFVRKPEGKWTIDELVKVVPPLFYEPVKQKL